MTPERAIALIEKHSLKIIRGSDQRAMRIAAALMLGKTGREAIDTAMESKP